jgi:hypothetical protein
MSRRHSAEKREINPDPKFGDLVITKFMNAIMMHGKKSVAEQIVYGALDQVEARSKRSRSPSFIRLSTMSRRTWKSARAASVVQPTRCRSMCVPSAVRHSPFAG